MKRKKRIILFAIILVSGISAQCTTDSSLFSLTCTGVSFKIDVDESCLNSGQSKYSLSADFDTSIYVSSDSSDNSDIDDTDIDAECKMNAASSSTEKKIEFNIDKCVEHSIQPGVDVAKDKWLHPTTGAVSDSDPGSGTQVTKDSIKFTYFIHHQRKIGATGSQVSISSMSPVPVSCLIEKEVIKNSGNIAIDAQPQAVIQRDTVFDPSMVTLVVTPDADMAVGSLATLSLNVATTPVDYQTEFNFAIKDCYSGLGKADPNAADNKKVQMLENFCRVTAFDEIITKDTASSAKNTDVNNFQSFKFVIFKYPNEPNVVFTCTVTVFHKDVTDNQLGTCALHGSSSGRKKRSAGPVPSTSFQVSGKVNIPDKTPKDKLLQKIKLLKDQVEKKSNEATSLMSFFALTVLAIFL